MSDIVENDSTGGVPAHTFAFAQSNHRISLNEEQLRRIPYLHALVSNDDRLHCPRTEDDAFILNDPIRYELLKPILEAVLAQESSRLFMKLPRDVNVFGMLELYEYLCVEPLSSPSLTPTKEIYENNPRLFRREYRRASLVDARDTAVEFIVAIANGQYDLKDNKVVQTIFDLIVDILSSISVFGQRLRYQTLVVVENCLADIFTSDQRALLLAYKRSLERLNDSDDNIDGSYQMVEPSVDHIFAWKRDLRLPAGTRWASSADFIWPSSSLDDLWSFLYLGRLVHDFNDCPSPARCRQCNPSLSLPEDELFFCWCNSTRDLCKQCGKRKEIADLRRHAGKRISCRCGYLRIWLGKEWDQLSLEKRRTIYNFYRGRRVSLDCFDFRVQACLTEFCDPPDFVKDKRQWKLVYARRSFHLYPYLLMIKAKKRRGLSPRGALIREGEACVYFK